MGYELNVTLRLIMAAVLGGLIGLERESLNKAAGFRTHTLVCVGSCLIMIISIEMYTRVGQQQIGDPARLAAQVVSGIGFLGAGTIMRSGLGVKGLTTAATLWVVAGIGLAVGAGSYFPAVVSTAIVFLVLVYLSRIEAVIRTNKKQRILSLLIEDKPGQIGLVCSALGDMEVDIRNIELSEPQKDQRVKVALTLILPYYLKETEMIDTIRRLPGVYSVNF
ncbi:MAG: MgtC/SapB family protein [Bacillota bacterium]|jgi:putative Mg2+ transporter-C (MgtC) family protein|uniref:Methyltransferase n=1 Tax=Thermanaerosceptrum fracticalcis TaxID=1712410 RepID=A0A7G6E0X5_THEFR|nr:MgtC/SapB family protein [Thermanaerosceptrum fracticalcis]MBZ4655128.1 MgtC/SapB transporter [Peptococcaceae bacterium]QNB45729.1 methyltransferase [Thermanaerosceptrum fracticalcis]